MGRFECSVKEGFFIGVIYKYTNKNNNSCYIGKTINPSQRRKAHVSSSFNSKDPSYDAPLHRAIRKHGLDSFNYDILYTSDDEAELLEKEKEYIKSYRERGHRLYNITEGGEGWSWSEEGREKLAKVSQFKNANLTKEEVIKIRRSYESGDSPSEVWKEFPQIKHYNSFLNIWCGSRYSYIMPEVFVNNKRDKRLKLTNEIAEEIRESYKKENVSYRDLALRYNVAKGTIADVIKRRTFK